MDPYIRKKGPEIIFPNGKKRPAKEIGIWGTQIGPSRFDLSLKEPDDGRKKNSVSYEELPR